MDLQINTGARHLPVVRDGVAVGELVFNPQDVLFAERFYKLINAFQARLQDYKNRADELDAQAGNDENGLPVNAGAKIELVRDACQYIREQIDELFGAGTSQLLFGDAMMLDMFAQFFNGIMPYISTARTEKVQRYTNKKRAKK